MMAFFSKRKDGGKSNSDSSLYPPPSLTTRRAKPKRANTVDIASMPSTESAAPWDGKCPRCRKLMSRCLCHEDSGTEDRSVVDRGVSKSHREFGEAASPSSDKRHLLETLSGMHQSHSRPRVPLKMTQDRIRDRRLRESQRFPNHTLLATQSSNSSMHIFEPTRSVGLNKSSTDHDDPSSDRFTRSCPDVKWRSSTAITSTMRLAHDRETAPPRTGQPKNLLAYDNKKLTNRFNHVQAAVPPKPPKAAVVPPPSRTPSGNVYIIEPVKRRSRENDDNPNFDRVWEL